MKNPMPRVFCFSLSSGYETLSRLLFAAKAFCLGDDLELARDRIDEQPLTSLLPAGRLNAMPRFDFAVYSLRDESEEAELEDSCRSRADAETVFSAYQTTRFTGITFFLVDWSEQRTLRIFRYEAKAIEPNLESANLRQCDEN